MIDALLYPVGTKKDRDPCRCVQGQTAGKSVCVCVCSETNVYDSLDADSDYISLITRIKRFYQCLYNRAELECPLHCAVVKVNPTL